MFFNPLTAVPTTLLVLAFWLRPPVYLDPPSVTVLCYHTFDAANVTPYTVDSARFREQLQYLKDQRLAVISLAQFRDYIRSGSGVPEHSVLITIDDGYKTVRTKAYPLLKEFGYPFTVFVYPKYIGKRGALNWDDVEMLAENGVDFQSHSLSHPLLTHPAVPMSPAEYEAWIDQELVESKRILEDRLKKPVTALAYPYGGYDEKIVERVKKAGYEFAFTCDDANVTRWTDPLHVNRRLVFNQVGPEKFAWLFKDRTLQVADLTPRDGQRLSRRPAELQGRIVNMAQVKPGSASIWVDKAGPKPYLLTVNPKTGRFKFPLPPKNGYYFVSLFASDNNEDKVLRNASWLFIINRNASRN